MANIRNSISMTDRMTPTLRSILKSMDSVLRVMKDLDKASNNGAQSKAYKRAEKDIQRANNALIKMDNHTQTANRSAREGERAYSRMGAAVSRVGAGLTAVGQSSTMFLQSLASGVYLAQKLADTVSGIMETADTSRSQVARLGLYNTSEYTNEELYGQVFRTALDTRSGLTDTADLTNKILISGVYSGEGAAQAAINTAGLINKALVAGGGTDEENQRALRQLTQGLASGVLQGDELRSIREQTPYFAQMLAEGLAQVDEQFKGIGIGDLKELGAEGELTAERVVKAMWAMQDDINSDFEAMPKTFGQAITSLQNIWQYFLWMLSDVDGPLGKLNDRLWQFVEYLQSPQGLELMNTVAIGVNIVTTALSGALGAAGEFVTFLQENAPIAQALFIALGVAAAAAAIMAMVAWIAAIWPILLIMGLVGLVAYQFLKAGYTAQEVVGAIAGGVLWLGAVIWGTLLIIVDAVMWLAAIILITVIGVGAGIILVLQAIVQIVLFVILTIWTAIEAIGLGIATVFMALWGGIQAVLGWIVDGVYTGLSTVLDIIALVASAIDELFGTKLSDSVASVTAKVDEVYTTVSGFLDSDETFESIGDMWDEFGERTADRYSQDSDWNITDNMEGVWNGAGDMINGVLDLTGQGEDFLQGLVIDPNAAYGTGYDWGAGIVDEIGNLELGIPDSSVLDMFNEEGVEVNGGYLDGIKSDVDINDEDLQLLRDMAARDYLLQLQTVTPVANVTFGDVRETADVGKIVEVIEQMVDEQMATALVS